MRIVQEDPSHWRVDGLTSRDFNDFLDFLRSMLPARMSLTFAGVQYDFTTEAERWRFAQGFEAAWDIIDEEEFDRNRCLDEIDVLREG